jgi:hypothetical protein
MARSFVIDNLQSGLGLEFVRYLEGFALKDYRFAFIAPFYCISDSMGLDELAPFIRSLEYRDAIGTANSDLTNG